jgi:hypothetical protein
MAAAVYLVGVLQTRDNVHQNLNQRHGAMEKNIASSPRETARPGKEQRWLHMRRDGDNRRRDPNWWKVTARVAKSRGDTKGKLQGWGRRFIVLGWHIRQGLPRGFQDRVSRGKEIPLGHAQGRTWRRCLAGPARQRQRGGGPGCQWEKGGGREGARAGLPGLGRSLLGCGGEESQGVGERTGPQGARRLGLGRKATR